MVAAGLGRRFGGQAPKQFLQAAGRPLLAWSVAALSSLEEIERIVVVLPEASLEEWAPAAEEWSKGKAVAVAGGSDRQESVYLGLQAVGDGCGWVLVHDGARPCVTAEWARRVLQAAFRSRSATLAAPVADTLRRQASPKDGESAVVPRDGLWAVQTPQAFDRRLLMEAHERAIRDGFRGTDDVTLVERLGVQPELVEGPRWNMKVTAPGDLELVEAWLGRAWAAQASAQGGLDRPGGTEEAQAGLRVGIGYDVHRTAEGRPLILGGVSVEAPFGLLGHSDADVLTHAVMDALLGAAALGDIGKHFPDTDPAYAGASSIRLLEEVARLLKIEGWRVGNVDATVTAERPKLQPYIPAMRAKLAEALQVEAEAVSVKATTAERLGFAGAGEGIEARAVALIVKA